MTRIEHWPPPDWTEVVITWEWLMVSYSRSIRDICQRIDDQPGGRYHLHGKGEARDFAFRFEDPKDALWFRLIIPA